MKRLFITLPLIVTLVGFVALGIENVREQKQLNDNINVELIQKELKLNDLNKQNGELDTNLDIEKNKAEEHREKIQQLESEKSNLEKQLQSKLDAKNKAIAEAGGLCNYWILQAGIQEVDLAKELIRRESNCRPEAVNPSSGACGVAQELPCGKSGCDRKDGQCQVTWMNTYVAKRYGNFANAIAWHDRMNWY